MADYEMFITSDMESKVKVQIHDADVEKAGELVERVDDPEAVAKMMDQMTQDRLDAVLTVAFRAGGNVFEATKLTFGQDGITSVHPGRDLESNENKLTKNYIIPREGEDKLKDIFSGNVHVSFDDSGSRFKITRRDMPDALGDKGFTLIWESKGASGNPITFELNFFYGMEENKMEVSDTQFGVEDVDFGGMNMTGENNAEVQIGDGNKEPVQRDKLEKVN